ncbi:DNA polymerase I [Thioalkalivibrio sp. XN279]|uniref:DNA polymerase I n=1 Tax=Thioalkalivibrio sp. XN279 TaxID=2714953 RepID=UPI00140810FE|nr:DNA polymerase I [Thioalkalivibrio sp. XN279]NHA13807.1 DNA polymerase I [Thioalkalivibrio sp. XN279]
MSKPQLVLVDGSSYLYRAFHALPPLTNSRDEPVGAVLGVVNMLLKLIEEHRPEHFAVVFDARGKTFRDELFAEYKANRPPMPDELSAQVGPLLEIVQALGLPILQVSGVEADDVIGTLTQQARAAGMRTLVSTGDKDMAQLVNGDVTLVNTMTGKVLDRAGVEEKFGVPPERIVDWLALVGDSSDNIPGVPKCGPKTATKWLTEFGDLDTLKARADEVGGKIGESLRAHLEQLELSRELATIRCDVELEQGPADLKPDAPDVPRLRELYTRLEFNTLLRKLPEGDAPQAAGAAEDTPATIVADYETVFTAAQLDDWLARLAAAEDFAFDTETDSLDYMQARIVGVSFAVEPGCAAYVPLAHHDPDAPQQLDLEATLAKLKPLLEDPARGKIGHHLKYDMHVLANHGVALQGIRYDTMLESYVLDSTATRHDMDSVALKYLGYETIRYEDVAGKGAKQITFDQVPVATAAPYAAEDADVTLRLHRELWPRLVETPGLQSVYADIELPLVPILGAMERHGVLLDTALLKRQSRELEQGMAAAEAAAFAAAGGKFNIGSAKQLQEILFERLGLTPLRKTPGGQPSTAEDVLEELSAEHELPRRVLEYRGLAKLKSTYTDKLPELCDAGHRVHTSYHQAVAATGRLSSSDPNLQNIPVRTAEGRRIRQAFIAPDGYRLVAADYSQIELRIMAHLSGDEGLQAAFREDQDIHRATAAEVFETPLDEVTPEQRRSAKAINFGLIYGMSAFGLARQLGIERAAAQEYVQLYFERYPGVKRYMDETRRRAREDGYVTTVLGRRLHLPEIRSRNSQRRQYAERSAINAPMQGTAADIIKLAMIRVADWLAAGKVDARLIMQVHDELVFEVAERDVQALVEALDHLMGDAVELSVPLKVDAAAGLNWDEAH